MTIAGMKLFARIALAIPEQEDGDVVYAGATARDLQTRADDEAVKAAARGDQPSEAAWRMRSYHLGVINQVAPGAVGIRWRESQDRLYFIVPGLGHVQSVEADQFVQYFSGLLDAALYAAMDRGINAVYEVVEGWGWTKR